MARINNRKIVPIHGTGAPNENVGLAVGEIAVSTETGKEALYTRNNAGNIAKINLAHFTILSQAEYDSLQEKDTNMIYYIK